MPFDFANASSSLCETENYSLRKVPKQICVFAKMTTRLQMQSGQYLHFSALFRF